MKDFKNNFFIRNKKFFSKLLFNSKILMFNEFQKLKIIITHHFPDNYLATNKIGIFNLGSFYGISHKTDIILYSYILFKKIHSPLKKKKIKKNLYNKYNKSHI